MDCEVEGVKEKTWSEVIEKDCQTRQICKEDASDLTNMQGRCYGL